MIFVKTLIFTVLVPGTVTVLVPWLILSGSDRAGGQGLGPLRYLGGIPILLGFFMYCWCAWNFASFGRGTPAPVDPPRRLVVRGPYRLSRNPMYVGVLSVLLGEALLFGSVRLLVYALLVFAMFQLFVRAYEEPKLSRTFGQAYEDYRASVPRWLPTGRPARQKGPAPEQPPRDVS